MDEGVAQQEGNGGIPVVTQNHDSSENETQATMGEEHRLKLRMVSSTLEDLMQQQREVDRTLQHHKLNLLPLDTIHGMMEEETALPGAKSHAPMMNQEASQDDGKGSERVITPASIKLLKVLEEVEGYQRAQTELEGMLKDLTQVLDIVCVSHKNGGIIKNASRDNIQHDESSVTIPREKVQLLAQTLDMVRKSSDEQQVKSHLMLPPLLPCKNNYN